VRGKVVRGKGLRGESLHITENTVGELSGQLSGKRTHTVWLHSSRMKIICDCTSLTEAVFELLLTFACSLKHFPGGLDNLLGQMHLFRNGIGIGSVFPEQLDNLIAVTAKNVSICSQEYKPLRLYPWLNFDSAFFISLLNLGALLATLGASFATLGASFVIFGRIFSIPLTIFGASFISLGASFAIRGASLPRSWAMAPTGGGIDAASLIGSASEADSRPRTI
jgi:hypothetical protein